MPCCCSHRLGRHWDRFDEARKAKVRLSIRHVLGTDEVALCRLARDPNATLNHLRAELERLSEKHEAPFAYLKNLLEILIDALSARWVNRLRKVQRSELVLFRCARLRTQCRRRLVSQKVQVS